MRCSLEFGKRFRLVMTGRFAVPLYCCSRALANSMIAQLLLQYEEKATRAIRKRPKKSNSRLLPQMTTGGDADGQHAWQTTLR